MAAAVAAVLYPLADVHAEGIDEPLAVLVIGSRASLATAQDIKRDKLEIVDSIVAEDIGKLPDFSVTDAIQRVTGVQVARDRGDGANVAIRGLTQVETTLNGREIFTAWFGRNLDYADIPAELLAGIDVYKSSSAQQLEGGVGGLVDLRTRRPFDFAGPQAVATVREVQGDLANQRKPQYSALLSNRWKTEDAGEIGILLSVSQQDRAFREDQKTVGYWVPRSFGGQPVNVPSGSTESASAGTRKRDGASFALQWRPNHDLDLYAEGSYAELRTIQNTYQFFADTKAAAIGSLALAPGAADAQGVGWSNAAITTAGAARNTIDRIGQFAVGGSWYRRETTVKADLSYTKSHNNLMYSALALSGASTGLSQDLAPAVPSSTTSGSSVLSLSSFNNASIWYASRPFDGELKALRLDAERRVGGDYLDSVSTGLRVARRHATDAPGQVSYYPAAVPAANAAGVVTANPYGDFFPGSTSVRNFVVGDANAARNVDALRGALGIGAAIPAGNPLGTWDIREDTDSVYGMATI
ncbi:MAG TPA: TonB-dependent receptor, partial [Rhodocyclaceae bacterium]